MILRFIASFIILGGIAGNSLVAAALSDDTTPPTFTNRPTDRSVDCEDDYLQAFTDWYNTSAGATATDNSGQVEIRAVLPLEAAIDSFLFAYTNQCATSAEYGVGFYAIDTCQNSSDTIVAMFSTVDDSRPQVIQSPQDVSTSCNGNTQQELNDWMDSMAFAEVADVCAIVLDTSFIWIVNGNTFGEGRPGAGPYPDIEAAGCSWFVQVSFLVKDNCGNQIAFSSRFSVMDSSPPSFSSLPENITLSCDELGDFPIVEAVDNCSNVKLDIQNNSTRSDDPSECQFYTYTIERIYTASDGCSDPITTSHIIEVVDDQAPSFASVPSMVEIDCDRIDDLPDVRPLDNCDASPETNVIENSDQSADTNECAYYNYTITREYESVDACGNQSTFIQTVLVQDTMAPQWTSTPPEDVEVTDGVIPDPADIVAMDNCSGELVPIFSERSTRSDDPADCSFFKYTITRNWEVADICGNLLVHSQVIDITSSTTEDIEFAQDTTVLCHQVDDLPTEIEGFIVTFDDESTQGVDSTLCDFFEYTINRTWMATNACDEEFMAVQVISVVDTLAADVFIIPPDTTIYNNDLSGLLITTTAIDLCDEVLTTTFRDSIARGSDPEICSFYNYPIFRIWSSRDACGNVAQDTQLISVVDTTLVSDLLIPQDTVLLCDQLTTLVDTFLNFTLVDQTEVARSLDSTTCEYYNYQLIRNWNTVSLCGDTIRAAQTITVVDTIAPVFVNTPNDTIINSADLDLLSPELSSVDACAGDVDGVLDVSSTKSDDPNDCSFFNYTLTRTWEAIDPCGNSRSHTQIVQVSDDGSSLSFEFPADTTILCSQIASLADTIPGSDAVFTETTTKGTNPSLCGFYQYTIERNWSTVDVCGEEISKVQVIEVVDTLAPTFVSVPIDTAVFLEDFPAIREDASSEDNCQSIPGLVFSDISTRSADSLSCDFFNFSVMRIWSTFDVCGNTTRDTQNIEVIDTNTAGSIILPIDITISCEEVDDLPTTIVGFTGNLTISSDRSVDTSSCAFFNYTLNRTWNGSDPCGESISHTQIVEVIDTLAPIVTRPDDITIHCSTSSDTTETGVPIPMDDACNIGLDINFSDTESIVDCARVITRSWQIVDPCGNSDIFPQVITVVDTLKPVIVQMALDTAVFCDTGVDITAAFNNWISIQGSAEATDDCADLKRFAAIPGTYDIDDNTSFPGMPPGSLDIVECQSGSDLIYQEQVDFVFVDDCGNATVTVATFSVRDTLAPQFVLPIEDITLSAQGVDCNSSRNIPFPELEGDCTDDEIIRRAFIGSIQLALTAQFETDTLLQEGSHVIDFQVEDCHGNINTVQQNISVVRDAQPESTCPSDIEVFLTTGRCDIDLELPRQFAYDDPCNSGELITVEAMDVDSSLYLSFTNADIQGNSIFDKHDIVFENVSASAFESDPLLTLALIGNFAADTIFILGEDLSVISSVILDSVSCSQQQSVQIEIDIDAFNNWASDGILQLTIEAGSTSIFQSCTNIDGASRDGVSRVEGSIEFLSLVPRYFITGAVTTPIQNFPLPDLQPKIRFQQGVSDVNYIFTNRFGEQDTCSYQVTVRDTIKPSLICFSTQVIVPEVSDGLTLLTEELLVDTLFDNCEIVDLAFDPVGVDCSAIGSRVPITLTTRDAAGNVTICQTTVDVAARTNRPSFESGICGGDTLKFFSNQEVQNGTLQFQWTGPNNFSSTQEDPFIVSADATASGIYSLTVRNDQGCSATYEVDVELQSLPVPDLSSEEVSACSDKQIRLISSPFTGNVEYKWYQNVGGLNILLDSTTVPSFDIARPLGSYEFVVLAESDDCATGFSESLKVEYIAEVPVSMSTNATDVCAGETVVFELADADPSIEYVWSGPQGFDTITSGDLAFEIPNANYGGTYRVSSKVGGCISAPSEVSIQVRAKPDRPEIIGADAFCEGSEIRLETTNIDDVFQYRWLQNGRLHGIRNNNPVLVLEDADATVEGHWQVITTNRVNCVSDTSDVFPIEIQEAVGVNLSSNSPICATDLLNLEITSEESASYMWTGPNDFESTSSSLQIDPIPGIYRVEVSTSSGCIIRRETEVVVHEIPVFADLTNSSEDADCSSVVETVEFFYTLAPQSSDYQFSWTGPNGFSSTEPFPTVQNEDATQGTYTVEITLGTCESLIMSTEVVSTAALASPSITSAFTGCEGDDIVINADGDLNDVSTYFWTTPAGEIQTTESSLTIANGSESDFGNYSLVIAKGECVSDPSNTIVVNASEVVTPVISGTQEVCDGESILLNVSPAQSGLKYIWTTPSGQIETDEGLLSISSASAQDFGDYTVLVESGNCLSDNSIVFSIVQRSLSAPRITETQEICIGDSFFIEADASVDNAEYIWTTPSGEVITSEARLDINQSESSSLGRYTLEVRVGSCTSGTSNAVSISGAELESPLINGPSEVCIGDAILVEVEQPINNAEYIWTTPTGEVVTTEARLDISQSESSSIGSYTLQVKVGNCFSSSSNAINISGRELEAPVLSAPDEVCIGDSFVVEAEQSIDNAQYIWTTPTGEVITSEARIEVTDGSASSLGNYSLQIQVGECLSEISSAITVTGLAVDVPVISSPPGVCIGDDIELTLEQEIPGAQYIWTTPRGERTTDSPRLLIESGSSGDAGEYSVFASIGVCSSARSDIANLNVASPPSKPLAEFEGPVCEGSLLRLKVVDPDPQLMYEWEGPNNFTSNSTNPSLFNVDSSFEGVYRVRIANGNCSSDWSEELSVAFETLPGVPQIISADAIDVCSNSTLQLCIDENSTTDGVRYVWNLNFNEIILLDSTAACIEITDFGSFEEGENPLSVYAQNGSCLSTLSNVIMVNLDIPPQVEADAGEDQLFCSGEAVTLSGNQFNGVSGQWFPISEEANIVDPSAANAVVTSAPFGYSDYIWILADDNCGILSRDTTRIYVERLPLLMDDELTIVAGETADLDFLENDSLPVNYEIFSDDLPSDLDIEGFFDGLSSIATSEGTNQTYEWQYTVCSTICPDVCAEATISVRVEENLECNAPSIFSPNGDGINDAFVVPCLQSSRYDSKLIIYNEWGDQVYSAQPYNNDWRGTHNGNALPQGTYYYVLEVTEDVPAIFKGFIQLEL